jgi:hypothetical protein
LFPRIFWDSEAKKAVTFLKKSNQKTFAQLGRAGDAGTGQSEQKFFYFFFSKKGVLTCF